MKTLTDARKENKITQGQLAQLLKVSQVSVSNWERGFCLPNPDTQERIEAILGEQIYWNADAPLDDQERQAVANMAADVAHRQSHKAATDLIVNSSNRELRYLIRSLGYLEDPLLEPRDPALEKVMIRRKK